MEKLNSDIDIKNKSIVEKVSNSMDSMIKYAFNSFLTAIIDVSVILKQKLENDSVLKNKHFKNFYKNATVFQFINSIDIETSRKLMNIIASYNNKNDRFHVFAGNDCGLEHAHYSFTFESLKKNIMHNSIADLIYYTANNHHLPLILTFVDYTVNNYEHGIGTDDISSTLNIHLDIPTLFESFFTILIDYGNKNVKDIINVLDYFVNVRDSKVFSDIEKSIDDIVKFLSAQTIKSMFVTIDKFNNEKNNLLFKMSKRFLNIDKTKFKKGNFKYIRDKLNLFTTILSELKVNAIKPIDDSEQAEYDSPSYFIEMAYRKLITLNTICSNLEVKYNKKLEGNYKNTLNMHFAKDKLLVSKYISRNLSKETSCYLRFGIDSIEDSININESTAINEYKKLLLHKLIKQRENYKFFLNKVIMLLSNISIEFKITSDNNSTVSNNKIKTFRLLSYALFTDVKYLIAYDDRVVFILNFCPFNSYRNNKRRINSYIIPLFDNMLERSNIINYLDTPHKYDTKPKININKYFDIIMGDSPYFFRSFIKELQACLRRVLDAPIDKDKINGDNNSVFCYFFNELKRRKPSNYNSDVTITEENFSSIKPDNTALNLVNKMNTLESQNNMYPIGVKNYKEIEKQFNTEVLPLFFK